MNQHSSIYNMNLKSGIKENIMVLMYIGKYKWALQCAVADTYRQFLNKHETLNVWSQCVYRQNDGEYTKKLVSMIKYAANDCLAVTKLAYIIGQDIRSMSKEPICPHT